MKELQLIGFNGDQNDVRVSHRALAEFMGLRQDNIRNLIEDNIGVFEEISPCPFEKEMVEVGLGTRRETKVYYLDSDQANLLIGLTRNTEITIELKANVVKAFKEAKKQQKQTTKSLSLEESTLIRYKFLLENTCAIADLLGYSQGYKRKEALQIGFALESETGIKVTPSYLTNDPEATNPEPLSERTGTHAAYVGIGTHGSTPSSIAQSFGKDISPTDVNNILVTNGYQTRFASGKYKPTEKGTILCNQSTLASGKYRGNVIVKEWLFNSNKAFRDDIAQAVIGLRKRRSNNLINSKAHIRCV